MRSACHGLLGLGLMMVPNLGADPSQIFSLSTSGDLAWVNNLQGVDQRFLQIVWPNPPLADSFNDFRGTQGNHGWRYGYALPASAAPTSPVWFHALPAFTDGTRLVDANLFWTAPGRKTMHPNSTVTSGAHLDLAIDPNAPDDLSDVAEHPVLIYRK